MENETLYETAKFFHNKKRAVHITKKDSRFHNGIILEVRPEFFILNDEILGEMPIFYAEINLIEPREPKPEGKE